MACCRLSCARFVLVKLEMVRLSMKPTLSLTSRQPKTNMMTSSIHVSGPSLFMLPSMLDRDSLDLGVFCCFCTLSGDKSSKLRFSPRPLIRGSRPGDAVKSNCMEGWLTEDDNDNIGADPEPRCDANDSSLAVGCSCRRPVSGGDTSLLERNMTGTCSQMSGDCEEMWAFLN